MEWSTPLNAIEDCISEYRVSVDGNIITTGDNRTSVSLNEGDCGVHEITVTPVVSSIGAVTGSTSDTFTMEGWKKDSQDIYY